jgi:HSP20 family protein
MATLVRWDPSVEVDSLQSEMNRLFDGFFGARTGGNGNARRWVPAMDLAETEDELILTADLPGLDEDDISIEIKDGTLTLAGERKDTRQSEGRGYHRVERSFGRFSRTMSMPRGVDAESVRAHFHQGVLEVHIPKPEERKPHRVQISANGNGKPAIEGEAAEK